MIFNSFEFFLFFPIVTVLYFMLPHRLRWAMLLGASCVFYMFFVPEYILILFFTIVVDYVAGLMIENSVLHKKRYLVCSIIANVGVLAFFKYFNFFNENIKELADTIGWNYGVQSLAIILPIGLSFHTFQAMSYTIEVYRGNQKAEKHFGIYSLYVMFYPQLVAGPIERPQNVLHQFYEKHSFNYEMAKSGLLQMAWGLLKKVVIADRLATYVNPVFNNPGQFEGYQLIIATIFFLFQIYCDFSGYSDIALGAARVMGFRLMTNFNLPFASRSVTEFWRRWHISLSTWFNDYLFTPIITGLRYWGKLAIAFGLFITFFLSGFWHGAGWNFIIYGCMHGVALIYEFYTKKQRKKLFNRLPDTINNNLSILLTVGFVAVSWIFFRARNAEQGFYILSHLFSGTGFTDLIMSRIQGGALVFNTVIDRSDFKLCVLLIAGLCLLESLQRHKNIIKILFEPGQPRIVRWGVYYAAILIFVFLGVFNDTSFIYFQF